jgi:hypothetical protein
MECGKRMGNKKSKPESKAEADIAFDETISEVTVSSGDVVLRHVRSEPESGCIYIASENLPIVRIDIADWKDVESVLQSWRSVSSWLDVSMELGK